MAHFVVALKRGGIDPKTVPVFGYMLAGPDVVVAAGEAAEGLYGSGDYDEVSTDPVQQAWQQKGDRLREGDNK